MDAMVELAESRRDLNHQLALLSIGSQKDILYFILKPKVLSLAGGPHHLTVL